jgi:Dehydrogenases with different specificities (related to short-chain alcohol dehydrogenases)
LLLRISPKQTSFRFPLISRKPQAPMTPSSPWQRAFGGLDVLVHVMGGFAGGRTIAETDDATWEQMRDLNLSSAFYTFRAAIPYLRKSGSGRIVAIGSLTAAEPHAGLGAYVTFKSALTMLVRTVALKTKKRD